MGYVVTATSNAAVLGNTNVYYRRCAVSIKIYGKITVQKRSCPSSSVKHRRTELDKFYSKLRQEITIRNNLHRAIIFDIVTGLYARGGQHRLV